MQRIPQVLRITLVAAVLVFAGKVFYVTDPFNILLGREYYEARRGHVDLLCDYVNKVQYECTGAEKGQEGNFVCTDEKFWPPSRKLEKDRKCLVYSFKFGGDATFEDDAAKQGCEVHVFNPSENRYGGWVTNSGVILHRTGIMNKEKETKNGWKMRTLDSTMKALGNQGRIINVFKVNVSSTDVGMEELVMDHIFETGIHKCIGQYLVEIHMPGPMTNEDNFRRSKRLFNRFMKLRTEGYRIYHVNHVVSEEPGVTNEARKTKIIRSPTTIRWQINFVNQNVATICNETVLRAA